MREVSLAMQEIGMDSPINELKLPVILKNKILLTPGKWNGLVFTEESIREGYELTDWDNKENYALIYDHDERAINWLGHVKNVRLEKGNLVGDLEIWDRSLAEKLVLAGAKLGISARVLGIEDEQGLFHIKRFANFSIVYDPACKNAYINLSGRALNKESLLRLKPVDLSVTSSTEVSGDEIGGNANEKKYYGKKKKKKEDMSSKRCPHCGEELDDEDNEFDFLDDDEELKQITGMEKERKRRKMSVDEFYAVPRDPPSSSALPIFDEAHVRNAMARFNQTKFKSSEERAKAKRAIIRAAKKFGINIKNFEKLSSQSHSSNRNIELKGGNDLTDNMDENEKKDVVEQNSETVEEKTDEQQETKDESPEETADENKESVESEDSAEELSSKLNLVLSELRALNERIAKLEESKDESPSEESEETQEEKLSQKKKDVKSLSTVEMLKVPKGYSKGDVEFAEMLLSQAKLR